MFYVTSLATYFEHVKCFVCACIAERKGPKDQATEWHTIRRPRLTSASRMIKCRARVIQQTTLEYSSRTCSQTKKEGSNQTGVAILAPLDLILHHLTLAVLGVE